MRTRATRIILAAGIVPGIAMLGFTVSASADVPANVDVYGSNANAAGVHVVGATSQFESFGDGAINNRYPLAAVGQESAPASHAVASPADYGPLPGVVLASDPPQPFCPNPLPLPPPANCVVIPFPAHQPPPETYANAQYPNPPGNAEQTYSSGGSDHADARAAELSADAFGSYGGNGASAFNNATAEAHTLVKPDGSIHSYTHSHVSSANFGAFVIRNVDVITDALSVKGKGSATANVNHGVVDKGDGTPPLPVGSGPQGQTMSIPGAPSVPGPNNTATPEIPPTTVRIYAETPTKGTSGALGSICATGTIVEFTQPTTATGGYSRDIKYILGDGCSEASVLTIPDSVLNPAVAATIDSSGDLVGGNSVASSTTTTSSGNPGAAESFTGAPASTITAAGRSGAPAARARRLALAAARLPFPLAPIFFVWEALVLGAAASVVWARRARAMP